MQKTARALLPLLVWVGAEGVGAGWAAFPLAPKGRVVRAGARPTQLPSACLGPFFGTARAREPSQWPAVSASMACSSDVFLITLLKGSEQVTF